MRVFLYLLGLLGLFGFVGGCASRTVLGVGPLKVGGRVALHDMQLPSVSVQNGNELRFTLGPVSFGPIGSVGHFDNVCTLESYTGPTSSVDNN